MSKQDPLSQILKKLQDNANVHPQSYITWVSPLKVRSLTNSRIVLEADSDTALKMLRQRYYTVVHKAVQEVLGKHYELFFVNVTDPTGMEMDETMSDAAHQRGILNPKYTFDTFVVGDSNRFAHAVSLAVAELPSDAYNPLFLYGGVGLGKTHLMHAIGHYLRAEDPTMRILYITSERFTNDVIEAIKNQTMDKLRDRLRNVDVLMVDDIQFIAGKTSTQEEFFHTFNHLFQHGKQIIISSDRPPKDIPTLEERLQSRFGSGLSVDIQKPDYETRVAILRKKAEIEHFEVPDDVINFIAEKVKSNIRELEGSLTRVNAEATLKKQPITLEFAQDSLKGLVNTRDTLVITPDLIQQVVADYYRIEKSEMLSQRRNREIALPRQVAMFLTREMTNLSTTRIGEAFGGRDHTTVMHGCNKISKSSRDEQQLSKTLDELKTSIRER